MQTIDAFDKEFPDETACKKFLVSMRWPDGVRCPRCKSKERIYALKARPFHWVCCNKGCGERRGYRFSVTTRTIFENTKISLKLWFKVAYLVLTSKKGISALQVHRMIFGEESTHAYHTSWYMVMRWRAAMKGDAFPIESFWSLIKRGVVGTYHHVSKDYLPLYLNEFSWRFNNRKNSEMFADLIQSVGD